ncbi:TPA: hypothetical protein SMQ11_003823 [Proteus mirabilis]|nr:hypothetical protein [Proteus mirabilis]HEK1946727.1 hypothetical protein [Proteus mirabilis]
MFSKDEVNKINKKTFRDRVGEIKKDRNVFFFVAIFLVALVIYQSISINSLVEQTKKTKEVIFVKVEPNGTYSVKDFLPEDEQVISTALVNSLLDRYTRKRFGQHKETIEQDYGEASTFMSQSLAGSFIDEKGFNARKKIKDVLSNPDAQIIDIEVVDFDHYDVIDGVFDSQKKPVIRSTLVFNRIIKDKNGVFVKKEAVRLKVQWSLLPKSVLGQQSLAWLNVNPVGIVIIDQQEEAI